MAIQSEYYDPDTGIIHITDLYTGGSVPGGSTEGRELGLQNTTFNDVKMKILSIDYKLKIWTANSAGGGDWNVNGWNYNTSSFGQCIFGVNNEAGSPTTMTSVEDFTGTSGWPVHTDAWATACGNLVSISKRWKPRKLAFSDEQVAFISVTNDSASQAAPYWYSYMYIRGVRL